MSALTPERAFHGGVRTCIAWLHARADAMSDPHAKAILNTAAHDLGVDKPAPSLTPIGDRETIARIVDPLGYELFDEVVRCQLLPQRDAPPAETLNPAAWSAKERTDTALAKADAILALGAGS